MCFDPDSTPPVRPVEGAEVRHRPLVLEAADGNRFAAFEALADTESETAVVVLPDVRGLYRFYTELADRFAEAGYDAVAVDYFGRTAGVAERGDDFAFREHIEKMTFEGLTADVAAAVAHLRAGRPHRPVFTVGFCFGGSASWYQATTGLGITGAIGFYGNPARERPPGGGTVIERIPLMRCPILALMAGDDPSIPAETIAAFEGELARADVEHEVFTYPGAPHSFFDRKQSEFAAESEDAWGRVLAFIAEHRLDNVG